MTAAGFRRVALALDGATESAHQGHPDFRAGGRIFATLGYPDTQHGMVVLTPEQQRACTGDHPDAFTPVKGKWGEQGCTIVRLAAVDEEMLGDALTLAWQKATTTRVRARRATAAPARRPPGRRRP